MIKQTLNCGDMPVMDSLVQCGPDSFFKMIDIRPQFQGVSNPFHMPL